MFRIMAQTKDPGIYNAPPIDACVLSVSPHEEDHCSLERILRQPGCALKPEWTLIASPTLASATRVLRERAIPAVVCECELFPGTWREMLERIQLLPEPPLLIVTSRLADERLWAEALNLGAYDVLAKPFDATEVTRVIGSALRRWQAGHIARRLLRQAEVETMYSSSAQ